jgi:hypothetical protein
MKLFSAPAVPTELDLFGIEPGFSITPIAAELQVHFERGGSPAEGVRLVAMLERASSRAGAAKPRPRELAPRGTRLPTNWEPSDPEIAFALDRGMPQARVSTEAEKFKNYWTAKSGAGATKRDWSATWRNWIITTMERSNGLANYRGENPRAINASRRAATGSDAILAGMGRLARQVDERRMAEVFDGRKVSNDSAVAGKFDFESSRTA